MLPGQVPSEFPFRRLACLHQLLRVSEPLLFHRLVFHTPGAEFDNDREQVDALGCQAVQEFLFMTGIIFFGNNVFGLQRQLLKVPARPYNEGRPVGSCRMAAAVLAKSNIAICQRRFHRRKFSGAQVFLP